MTGVSETTFQAFVVDHEASTDPGVREFPLSGLDGDVLIEIEWSSLNYKDGLATLPKGQVARRSPLVIGVDLAGVVRESSDDRFAAGDNVIAHGYNLGVSHHGGIAELASVPADWVVALPDGLTTRDAMIYGTAGFTAALSLHALEERGLTPNDGPVLVTGATGGVGSSAVAALAAAGYEVHASTGKADAHEWLRSLGATTMLSRADVEEHAGRPLSKSLWPATIDSVGGQALAGALSATAYGGAVAASGLTGGVKLETTVMPFILRGVSLIGIDSAALDMTARNEIWSRLGSDLRPPDLEALVDEELGLADVQGGLDVLLAGGARGRKLVRPSS